MTDGVYYIRGDPVKGNRVFYIRSTRKRLWEEPRYITLQNYNCHKSGHCPSSCLLLKTQLNPIGLSVPYKKRFSATSPTG
jgi:hypothetical protein